MQGISKKIDQNTVALSISSRLSISRLLDNLSSGSHGQLMQILTKLMPIASGVRKPTTINAYDA